MRAEISQEIRGRGPTITSRNDDRCNLVLLAGASGLAKHYGHRLLFLSIVLRGNNHPMSPAGCRGRVLSLSAGLLLALTLGTAAPAAASFVAFESGQVRP